PELLHSDDLLGDGGHHLPGVDCRDCGATGWASTLLNSTAHQLDPARNLRAFYRAFFARDPLIRYVFPQRPLPPEAVALELATAERLFCQDCLTLQEHRSHSRQGVAASPPRACQSCSSPNLLVVRVPETTFKDARHHLRSSSDCPFCQAPQSLLLIGASAASLTSACASALFASSFNTDRKLLTFSDSVQDAAHRAGFIAARAYRTSFRTALTRTLQAAGRDLSLPELQEALLAHWHQALPDPVDFVATFLPTDMEWLKDWAALEESRQPSLAPDSPLVGLVEKRLRWEVIAEFGYRSRLGSSVEQAGALAATSLPPERLESVLLPLLSQLRNEVEALRGLEAPQLRQALVGWLHHLRQRGALPTPELVGGARGQGSRYLSSLGTDTFGFKLLDHLPNIGPTSNRPLFLASSSGRGAFETLASRKGRPTWAMAWLARATGLPEPAANQPAGAENLALALRLIVEALEASGLLLALPPGQGGERLWGLDPALVRVSASTTSLRCDTCQDGQTIPRTEQALWEAMPCLVAGCGGHYRTDLNGGLPLYRRLYRSGAVRRILAREHTGLLPRADRERLEFQFIHDGPLSHPNLLSATSTLEMGINIGDLSSLLLCSVPPEPANYLQRIGRAGRRDGQSLVATIVNATPHDLYFYGEPKAMLQGRVSPPGCYLDAAAILARQLVAFSLDRWVQSGLHPDDLPRQLKSVLDTLAINNWEKKQQRFPFTWLRWTRDHQRALLSDFLDLFAGDTVGAACRDQLAARFLAPEPEPTVGEEPSAEWVVRLLDRLEGHNAERKRLNREGTALNKRRLALEAIPPASRLTTQSEDLEAIQRELEALAELRKALENRPLLQDLTDGGLLPNYAFPEEGVTLQSVLWRRLTRKNRSGRSSETLHPPSYERPGSVAIRELVPEGVFYAQGRRLRIDQIDLSLNPIQRWRFCRACSTCLQEGEEGFHSPICPGCGDANFSDLHQVKEMARLRQVIASGDDALSRISDDRDDRTPTFFQRQLLVIPDLQRVEVTLAVNDGAFPFGVEYIAATTFREINFGALNPLGSGHQIAGQQFRVRGFELCSACGKVLKGEPQSRQHAYSCRYREDPENAKARQLLFLYRDFRSEALRFLLPDRLFWDEAGQSSFQAALGLGLKRHFSGRVDHLQATIATEPQPGASPATGGSQPRKTFLYLYDSVPGGTGYLRQLVEEGGERLRLVLAEAAGALQACSCHDGCYRCLYAYRRRFERERTSKARALEQWQLLSEHWPKLQNSARGLTSLTITTQLESELGRDGEAGE
ncbi:MAG: Zn-binding domain-containing protein, partial [Cyanobium sp.]